MTAFNWRRGLLRVWIALSALWLVLLIAIAYTSLNGERNQTFYYGVSTDKLYRSTFELPPVNQTSFNESPIATLVSPDGSATINFAESIFDDKKVIMLKSRDKAYDFGAFELNTIPAQRKGDLFAQAANLALNDRREQVHRLVVMALIPPAVLAALGLLVLWTIGGFVDRKVVR